MGGGCLELRNDSTPHEIYYSDVGTTADGVRIDLRVTNTSEYRAWNANRNGINGVNGVINLQQGV